MTQTEAGLLERSVRGRRSTQPDGRERAARATTAPPAASPPEPVETDASVWSTGQNTRYDLSGPLTESVTPS